MSSSRERGSSSGKKNGKKTAERRIEPAKAPEKAISGVQKLLKKRPAEAGRSLRASGNTNNPGKAVRRPDFMKRRNASGSPGENKVNPRTGLKKISQEERNAVVLRQRLVIACIFLILFCWFLRGVHYLRHFQKNTTINGVDVSSLTLKAAKEKLMREIPEDYTLTVDGPGGTTEVISGADLKVEIVSADNAKSALRSQNAFAWLWENGKKKTYEIELEISVDETVLETCISGLKMMEEAAMVQPRNAFLFENNTGRYELTPEVVGTKLDTAAAREALEAAVKSGKDYIDLTVCQILPEITSENENLNKRLTEWNRYLKSEGMTYLVCEETIVFDGPKIASLLTDDGTTVELDRTKIGDLVAEWTYDYNTYNSQFDFTTYDGTVVTIDPYGNYGYEIDDESLVDELYEHISNGDSGSYEVSYYHKPLYNYNNGLGGNYVEINIDKQHLWVYKDGECVVDTDVVTGLPVYGRTTYYGCYAINLMQEHAVLGDVNVEGYESEVNYWVRFNSGEGIHDADWRDSFGGKIWLYSGSHGCVNVPVDVMPDIYNNVEVGEAVVVYGHDYDPAVWDSGTTEVNTSYYENYYASLGE